MKERYPTYYEKFKCIADKCEDTCCAGWEIDIDNDSYAGYMKIGGELGDRLRSCIKTNDEEGYAGHGFILTGGMRCFDLIWAMTGGGPGFATDVLASVVYKKYAAGYYGLSTAGNVIMFVLIAIIAFPLQRFLQSKEAEL